MATVASMSDIPPPPPPSSGPPPYQPPPSPTPYAVPGAGSPPPPPGFGGPGSGGPGFGGPSFQNFQNFQTAPTRSKKALWSMILGIAGIVLCIVVLPSLVALILGILALREIGRSGGATGGKGMAIAGLVLGIVGVIGGGILIAVIATEVAGTTSVFDLEVGDCVELPEDGEEIARIETFDCDEPHGAEVVAVGEIGDDGDPYPGQSELIDQIGAACIEDFGEYVGMDYLSSEFDLFPITPTEDTWDDDRSYVCLAFDPDGDLTESIEGANR